MSAWDVIVAGAGPAGSVAAHALARAGASVLLVDRARFPRWKVCGGCLGPAALRSLRAAGLADFPDGSGVPLRTLALAAGRTSARVPLDGNVALSRSGLDMALFREAERAGADSRDEARALVVQVEEEALVVELSGPWGRQSVSGRVVLDATGLAGGLLRASPRRAHRGADETRPAAGVGALVDPRPDVVVADARIGLGAVFAPDACDVPPGELRMVVGERGYVGIVRVEDGSVTVGAALDARVVAKLGAAEAVESILVSAGQAALPRNATQGWRGTPPLTRRAAALASHRLFRLGDAATYIEPFTGEGIGWAVGAGLAVVPFVGAALEGWTPELASLWTRRQQRQAAAAHRTCRWLARGLRRPRLVRAALGIVRPFPWFARPIVRATARA